jgi:hypothetical protein
MLYIKPWNLKRLLRPAITYIQAIVQSGLNSELCNNFSELYNMVYFKIPIFVLSFNFMKKH